MSGSRCDSVREGLLEGAHDHDHLAGCRGCREVADALAAIDGALCRGPELDTSPDLVAPVIGRLAARPSGRLSVGLIAGASLAATALTLWAVMGSSDPATAQAAGDPIWGAFDRSLGRLREFAPVGSALLAGLYTAALSMVVRVAAAEI